MIPLDHAVICILLWFQFLYIIILTPWQLDKGCSHVPRHFWPKMTKHLEAPKPCSDSIPNRPRTPTLTLDLSSEPLPIISYQTIDINTSQCLSPPQCTPNFPTPGPRAWVMAGQWVNVPKTWRTFVYYTPKNSIDWDISTCQVQKYPPLQNIFTQTFLQTFLKCFFSEDNRLRCK